MIDNYEKGVCGYFVPNDEMTLIEGNTIDQEESSHVSTM